MFNASFPWSRRHFLERSLTGLAALSAGFVSSAAEPKRRFKVAAFSKAFQELSPLATANLVAEVGWDGIECPVRKGGHVLPERVEEDLPAMVEALKAKGKEVSMITTDIVNVSPLNERVLRTAARLGIRRYRLGSRSYTKDRPIAQQLREIQDDLKPLAALNRELGIMGGVQNHSGSNTVGAPIWDIYLLVKDLDPGSLGICFDIGHATLEGGYSWPIEAQLMEPHFAVVYVKDFAWQKAPRGWRAEWCPLGEGMVSSAFFDNLRKGSYSGIISQHHEYPLGEPAERLKHFKRDLAVLRGWLR